MASLAELARQRTPLDAGARAHLQRLVASWSLLSDFCFADLLLFAPVREVDGDASVVLAQIRPATSQTVHPRDWVGEIVPDEERPIVGRCLRLGEIIEGEITIRPLRERVRVLAIPVRHQGAVVAVLTRESTPSIGRQPGELERTYVDIFNRFARMISAGTFPYSTEEPQTGEAPRVGDGVILLDESGRVAYTSPNAVSALHRIGVHRNTEGLRLEELGLEGIVVKASLARLAPVTQEIERGPSGPLTGNQVPEITVLLRCLPIIEQGEVSGAVLLLRDISELRRRDRLLISKDATIREIHHRVKNNLQTISSLLRLQGRRLESAEAKAAIEESVRRVRAIALVHEILSREGSEDVPFVDIVRPICRTVEEAFHTPERPVRCEVKGDAGNLPAQVATPLAVVLNELLQNAFDHAYPEAVAGGGWEGLVDGQVTVRLERRSAAVLHVEVADDGVGLPPDFVLGETTGLGLSIVRTLVTSELGGTIELCSAGGSPERPGAKVVLDVPIVELPE